MSDNNASDKNKIGTNVRIYKLKMDATRNKKESARVPIWEQFTLSIDEAAEYFGIGQQRIRKLIDENVIPECILYIGTHVRIKRIKFEQFLNGVDAI